MVTLISPQSIAEEHGLERKDIIAIPPTRTQGRRLNNVGAWIQKEIDDMHSNANSGVRSKPLAFDVVRIRRVQEGEASLFQDIKDTEWYNHQEQSLQPLSNLVHGGMQRPPPRQSPLQHHYVVDLTEGDDSPEPSLGSSEPSEPTRRLMERAIAQPPKDTAGADLSATQHATAASTATSQPQTEQTPDKAQEERTQEGDNADAMPTQMREPIAVEQVRKPEVPQEVVGAPSDDALNEGQEINVPNGHDKGGTTPKENQCGQSNREAHDQSSLDPFELTEKYAQNVT